MVDTHTAWPDDGIRGWAPLRPTVLSHDGLVRGKPSPVQARLDEHSKVIIEHLQADGRVYAAIAKAVGISEAAVRQRRLLDSGVMQIVATGIHSGGLHPSGNDRHPA